MDPSSSGSTFQGSVRRRRHKLLLILKDADTVDGEVATERTVPVPKLGLPPELAPGPSSRLLEVDPVCHRLVLGVFLNHQNHSVNFHLLFGWYSSTLKGRRLRRGNALINVHGVPARLHLRQRKIGPGAVLKT